MFRVMLSGRALVVGEGLNAPRRGTPQSSSKSEKRVAVSEESWSSGRNFTPSGAAAKNLSKAT